MIESLTTEAEKQALKAEQLPAFSGVKLLHIKRKIAELLSLIGRNGIFDEYTQHDISHVDKMLEILDWLVPNETKAIMTPADWLLTVLSIYFHDLGMLVTSEEYKHRNSSGFPEYCEKVLFGGDNGPDYRARLEELPSDEKQRFLYQEFVRHKHAERVRDWITGRATDHIGVSRRQVSEVSELLGQFNPLFRRDLAWVCESHHLEDLSDFRKYKVAQPYGNSDAETANLQYVAILLRATDLLHITGDRTPSLVFRVVNPADPLSQQEWAKQMAVTRVRSKLGRDRDGNPDDAAPRDTIEVHAFFAQTNGFFGLTSYLLYAQDQMRKCCDWAQAAEKQQGSRYRFPWRFVDDTNIETEGFLRNTFEFTIDQAKILDLLTGHTLYNDTQVVLRELVQNALDAVRLQRIVDEQNGSCSEPGAVRIHWDSRTRVLSVEDNGTGMTQEIIERHLLKVGASRYQDSEFRRRYPNFSSISRFGIGLLSTFMIADSVEILTCNPDEEDARQLSLRSVHGRYLIRLLDKQTDETARHLAPHGTLVKLRVRPSATVPDVMQTARKWIVVPGCELTVTIDECSAVHVGFASPKEALAEQLLSKGIMVNDDGKLASRRKVRIEQRQMGAVTLAYAVEWSEYFHEWDFLSAGQEGREPAADEIFLGTCIEGVRVEMTTPGFDSAHIYAIANAQGPGAPKTNVVRSGLEMTPERTEMLRAIYSLYCNHLTTEMRDLYGERRFSLTWAAQECSYMLSKLLTPSSLRQSLGDAGKGPQEQELMWESVHRIPMFLIEHGGRRDAVSASDLAQYPSFWTIDSAFFRSAEMLIREVAGPVSLSDLIGNLLPESRQLPDDPILCGISTIRHLNDYVFSGKEIDIIKAYSDQRGVYVRWTQPTDPPRWRAFPRLSELLDFDRLEMYQLGEGLLTRRMGGREAGVILLGQGDIEVVGLSDEIGISLRGLRTKYLFPGNAVTSWLLLWLNRWTQDPSEEVGRNLAAIGVVVAELLDRGNSSCARDELSDRVDRVEQMLQTGRSRWRLRDTLDVKELLDFLECASWRTFDPWAWDRRSATQ
jgi:molecular chaperone HtpG